AEKAATLKKLTDVPKQARDKDIFASGFVTAASNDTAGGADLSLNPNFNVPSLNAFLKIKKASADKGDARNFEAGAKYRYTQPWRSAQMKAIAAALPGESLNALIRERQGNLLAGWILDIAGKLEGDPTDFEVTNLVTESTFQLQTMTKGFLGPKAFWRGFVLPAGAELGHGIGTNPTAANGTATQQVTNITRYKGGAGLTLYYDNDE